MNLQDTHFALFGFAERFALDADALDHAYRDVQAQVHPDRFARASAVEQRVALQWATRANEAYRTLREPLQRAIYLCTLRGQDPADENNTQMPKEFLMRQLAWRETLDDARSAGDTVSIERLDHELDVARGALRGDVELALDRDDDAARAAERVRQWMFVERFADDVRRARQALVAAVH